MRKFDLRSFLARVFLHRVLVEKDIQCCHLLLHTYDFRDQFIHLSFWPPNEKLNFFIVFFKDKSVIYWSACFFFVKKWIHFRQWNMKNDNHQQQRHSLGNIFPSSRRQDHNFFYWSCIIIESSYMYLFCTMVHSFNVSNTNV